jgi:uncharacterized membrane protein
MQSGMIGKPEIVTKPDDAGRCGLAGHQAVNSEVARWVRTSRAFATLPSLIRKYIGICVTKAPEHDVKRYVILYLATLIVLIPIDFLFLGIVAKGFFASEVGDMLGELRPVPAVLFYLLYVVGILIFVSGPANANWQSTLLYGALFGLFCYATFELTALSLLKHWTWPVVALDVSWGCFVTAVSSTLGLLIANWIAPRV